MKKKEDSHSLNDQNKQAIDYFKELLILWENAYKCAVISYVGLKTTDGPRLLFGHIILEVTRVGIKDTPFNFETEHVLAGRRVLDVAWPDIPSLLSTAGKGEVPFVNNDVALGVENERKISVDFYPIHHPLFNEGPRLSCLRIRGMAKYGLFAKITDSQQLDWELKAAKVPFDSLDDLLIHCNLPTLQQMGDSTMLEVMARTPGLIGAGSKIVQGKARIECRISSALKAQNLRIGYQVFQKGSIAKRASLDGSKLKWRRENDIKTGVCQIPVGAATLIKVFLSYKAVNLQEWWINDPQKQLNQRQALHQVFDNDLELLKRTLLEPESDKPHVFEGAVSMLFYLLGFSAANYGTIPKLQRGPDVIVVAPSGNVGVIECTVGLLDEKDKLAKLVQRTKLLKDKLIASGFGHLHAQAVIATPLRRGEIIANLDDAAKYDIAVISKENIEELLSQVSLPLNPERLFEYIKGLIPGGNPPMRA